MPTTKIKVSFGTLKCIRQGALWGEASWAFEAMVDGVKVGDSDLVFPVKSGDSVDLDQEAWGAVIDVSTRKSGDVVEISFAVNERTGGGSRSMGDVKLKINHPFANPLEQNMIGKPVGTVFKSSRFSIPVKVDIVESTGGSYSPSAIPVAKAGAAATENTVSSDDLKIRVEVSPVVPVLDASQTPPRPDFGPMSKPGANTPFAAPVDLGSPLPLNALANPSLIPVLQPTDPEFDAKCARIAATWIQPNDLDVTKLRWVVKSGPVKIKGSAKGVLCIEAYATSTADKPAEIELRWERDDGPILSLFRAWTGPILYIPLRATILIGSTANSKPRLTAQHVFKHINAANVLMYQAGLLFQPDNDKRRWDGAQAHPGAPGVFTIQVPKKDLTIGVNTNTPSLSMLLNCRPGAMHMCFVKSCDSAGIAGVATDRPGLPGAIRELDGAPSTSWVPPTGVLPDAAAQTVKMHTLDASSARTTKSDKDYLAKRQKVDPAFTQASYDKVFGAIMPDYTKPEDPDWPQTLAHEIGHVMGLRHRGNPGTDEASGQIGSHDEVNGKGGRGHPWLQNVMCYGYLQSQDFDLVQTKLLREHACALQVMPPEVPEPAKDDVLRELQRILAVPESGVWDDATEAAASKRMVRNGSTGEVVEWVQKRLQHYAIDCGPVDGICGSKTSGAITEFQRTHPPLTPDGVAGPKSMRSMVES